VCAVRICRFPGRLALSVSLCRSSGLTVVTVAVSRAHPAAAGAVERTVMLSRPACVDRGISYRPGGSGQARLRLCRGSGPRSGASVDRRDPRRALWSRSARAPDHSGLAAGGQRAGPRVGTPSPATRRPGGDRRDADPDGGAGGAVVLARCWRDVGVRNASPLDVTRPPRWPPFFESVNCLGGDVGPERHPPPRWPGPRFRSWS